MQKLCWFCLHSISEANFNIQSSRSHSSLSPAKLWGRRSNTGDQKPATLQTFATGWTELRREAWAWLPCSPPSQTQTQTHEGGSCTFICSLWIVKASYFWLNAHLSRVAIWSLPLIKALCSFMDAHSVASACLFMPVGKGWKAGTLEKAQWIKSEKQSST